MSIQKFKSSIDKGGIQQHNRFAIDITPPRALAGRSTFNVGLRCFACTWPGKTLMLKDDIIRYGYGAIDKIAHNTLYSDVHASFILDNTGETEAFFDDWALKIANSDLLSRVDPYLVGYKNDYATRITITKYGNRNQRIREVQLRDAFPVAIGDIQQGWDQNNSIAVLPVAFSYVDFRKYDVS